MPRGGARCKSTIFSIDSIIILKNLCFVKIKAAWRRPLDEFCDEFDTVLSGLIEVLFESFYIAVDPI